MTDTVYVALRRNGGSQPALHTDRDCRAIRDAETVVEKDREVCPTDAPDCKICSGEASTQSPTDMSGYHALKNADPEDLSS